MGVFSVIGKCHGIPPLGVDERSRNPLLVFIVFTVVCDPNTNLLLPRIGHENNTAQRKPGKSIGSTSHCSPFNCCLYKGDYPENLHVACFCPNKYRSFEPFLCLDLMDHVFRGDGGSRATRSSSDQPVLHYAAVAAGVGGRQAGGACPGAVRLSGVHRSCVR